MSGFRCRLGLTFGSSEVVVVFEYFQVIVFFVENSGVSSSLSSFLYECLEFEVVGSSIWKLLVLFSEVVTEKDFEEKIQFM